MLFRLLDKQAKLLGDTVAIVGEQRKLTFRQLRDESAAIAAHFQTRGCQCGDALLLGIPPTPEFYVVFYAAAALGMIVLPVLPSGRLPAAIVAKEPLFAVGSEEFLAQARSQCRSLQYCLSWEPTRGLIAMDGRTRFRRKKTFRTECVIGVSSSGSTGTPTIYFRSQELLIRRAEFRAKSLGVRPDDVLLSARPFNSGSSINSHVIMPLVAGCKVVVQERIKRFEAAAAIARERVTMLYTVPFVFELLASLPQDYPADFSSLRLCISGSAPLAPSIAETFFRRFGVEIRQRYGGSHIHPAFTYNFAGVSGAVGQTFGPFPITVLDEDGHGLKPEVIGEIAFDYDRIAHPWKKYLKQNPNRRGRYIHTGDLGRTDEQGNVYIVGRKSPFIKVRGNRVEPAEVESVLRAHPAVQEVFVFGTHRAEPNEAVGALVVAQGVDEVELIRHCAQHLDGYKCPRKIIFRSTLPRTAHGKMARSVIEREIASGNFDI